MRRMLVLGLLVLAGCQSGYWYDYKTNQRGDATPELLARLNRARAICNGEVARVPDAGFGREKIFKGCMVQQGFEVRPH